MHTAASVNIRQRTFGYTTEELKILLGPMARTGAEPLGAMGSDTPVAVLSKRPRLLFDYFVQSFAQVTNPPLDAIREELVTSLTCAIGPNGNLLDTKQVRQPQVSLPFPVINNDQLAKIANIENADGDKIAMKVRGLYRPEGGENALRARLTEICEQVSGAINRGVQYVVLSDRDSNAQWAPIPSLLLVSAVHHHLLRSANRTKTALVVEAGDVRETHHVAVLIGYGASAVNPYLAMESVEQLISTGDVVGVTPQDGVYNLIKGLGKGVLKIMSKMGISTVASYTGAQTFEALGLGQELVDEFFAGTHSQLGGVGLDVIAAEVSARHQMAYPESGIEQPHQPLLGGGEYQWRRDGEPHLFNPETVFRLQHATRERRYDIFKSYTRGVDDQSENLMTLRGLLKFKAGSRPAVPLEEVEPVSSIVKRFSTGAMSYGSISKEAHETPSPRRASAGKPRARAWRSSVPVVPMPCRSGRATSLPSTSRPSPLPVLSHRLLLTPEAETQGFTGETLGPTGPRRHARADVVRGLTRADPPRRRRVDRRHRARRHRRGRWVGRARRSSVPRPCSSVAIALRSSSCVPASRWCARSSPTA